MHEHHQRRQQQQTNNNAQRSNNQLLLLSSCQKIVTSHDVPAALCYLYLYYVVIHQIGSGWTLCPPMLLIRVLPFTRMIVDQRPSCSTYDSEVGTRMMQAHVYLLAIYVSSTKLLRVECGVIIDLKTALLKILNTVLGIYYRKANLCRLLL